MKMDRDEFDKIKMKIEHKGTEEFLEFYAGDFAIDDPTFQLLAERAEKALSEFHNYLDEQSERLDGNGTKTP